MRVPEGGRVAAVAGAIPFAPDELDTPAFVYDETAIVDAARFAAHLAHGDGLLLLYSVKALSLPQVLKLVAAQVDGFAVSSAFEARLAAGLAAPESTLHFTSPGLRDQDLGEIAERCDYLTFNSLTQCERFSARVRGQCAIGLRVKPSRSFVADQRFDPSRSGSKLGVALDRLPGGLPKGLGLHLHGNCESERLTDLLETVEDIEQRRPGLLASAAWINLGGGYLFEDCPDLHVLEVIAKRLSAGSRPVYLEPGAALVQSAGYLVAGVVDVFDGDQGPIAVLDASVNHVPEVLEFQYRPALWGETDGVGFPYRLAGASCLAGDLFGDYTLGEPLQVGSRLVFADVGSYSLVKAHMFNGIDLPTVYTVGEDGRPVPRCRFGYGAYLERNGGMDDAPE